MKIFFKDEVIQDRSLPQQLNAQSIQTEELTLAKPLEAALLAQLQQANARLPSSASHFQDWKVAFLHRLPS